VDDGAFWLLIDRLDWRHEGDDDRVTAPVVKALTKLPLTEIEAFEEILSKKLYALDGRAWAREIGSGWWGGDPPVSVDAFLYARCAVVANGRDFYDAVFADPTQMPKDTEFEALLFVGASAWEAKTGDEPTFMTSVSSETFSNRSGWPPGEREPEVPRPAVSPGSDTGTWGHDHGKLAVRNVIRQLVTGALTDPGLSAHLASSGQSLVMTPGRGVEPPPEPKPTRGGAATPWTAHIELWTKVEDQPDRQPSGLVAVIDLHRAGPSEVRGTLVRIEGEPTI
jgi:hypothetical protein